MQTAHEFLTPRNIFEKLIRDYEQLDMRVSGDNMFNHLQEWIKSAPIHGTEQGKRLVREANRQDCIKLCRDIITAKKNYKIIIHDSTLAEGEEPDFTGVPAKHDVESYKDGTKEFKFVVGETEFDPFQFKNNVLDIYKTYFHIK